VIGRFLGIDHGITRIGLAVSDAMGVSARELRVIQRKSKVEDFALINQIAQDEAVVAIIVGMPNNTTTEGIYSQADTVKLWIERFRETTNLPIVEWDEQLSSEDAKLLAKQQRRKAGEAIDDLAARVILQSYLDALNDGLATLPQRS
jgi:putative Holliday junction resolvase